MPAVHAGTVKVWNTSTRSWKERRQVVLVEVLIATLIGAIIVGFFLDLRYIPTEAARNLYFRLLPIVCAGVTWLFGLAAAKNLLKSMRVLK
jgi:hypothetical protein